MKNFLYSLISTLFVVFGFLAHAQNSRYEILATVEGIQDSTAILGFHLGEKRYSLDTSVVSEKGEMVFSGNRDLETGLYFLYSKSFYFEFVVEGDEFSFSTSREFPYDNLNITNSKPNELFKDFQLIMVNHQKAIRELTESLDSTSTKEDSIAMFDNMKVLNKRNQDQRDSIRDLAGSGYIYQLLTMMNLNPELRFSGDSLTAEEKKAQYNEYRRSYFDELDFSSQGLLRTPIFHSKLMEYFDRVTFQHPDSIIVSLDEILKKSEGNEELNRYILREMLVKYQNPKIMGMDKIFVHVADQYYLNGKTPWADEKLIKDLKEEMVFYRENQIGLQAPQIYMVDTLDKPQNLYAIEANYLVLFFYSPNCGHCKKKTPVLKEAYDRLAGKAEVAAVCTDTDVSKWKKFIRDYDLNWLNYADPKYKSNFRVQYNVRSTPQLYILDKNKKIIAKRLDVEQVEQFINDQIMLEGLGKS